MSKLEQAARALLVHWDTPAWKYLKPTGDLMAALREALDHSGEANEMVEFFSKEMKNKISVARAEQAEQEPLMITPGGGAFPFAVVGELEQAEPMTDTELINANCRYTTPLMAEQAEQEPVAWVDLEQWQSGEYDCFTSEKVADYMTPLYAAPVRTKDLTDQEIQKLRHKIDWTAEWSYVNFARAVIAADRELNK